MTKPVVKTIEVPCDAATAFMVFFEKMASWWPLDKHSISAMDGKVAKSVSIEPKVGGKIVEIAYDGTAHEWGKVTRYDQGKRLTLDWAVGDTPRSAPTVVDIVFTDLDGTTRVELTHDNWQVYGKRANELRDGYNSGWVGVFENAYASACADSIAIAS